MYPKDYDPEKFVSKAGNRYKIEYIGEPDEKGFINLVEVGKTDLLEYHMRDAFANDVSVLYSRFCNGDISVLTQRQGLYLDMLGMPKDLRGMFEFMNGFRVAYDNMDEDFRKEYSYEQFIVEAGSSKWIEEVRKAKGKGVEPGQTGQAAPAGSDGFSS